MLAVTGSTGRVGGRVARALAGQGTPLRLLVRDPSRAPGLPGADVRVAAYADGDAAREALEGVDVLLMVSGAEAEDRLARHRTFVAAAADAGVRHVVCTRLSAVAVDDVAEVATAVLLEPERHARTAYDLTGPEAFTLAEAASRVTALTGRPVRYVEETLEEAYRSREPYGAPRWQVDAWVSTYTAIAAGEVAGVSGDVERVLGRPPRSLDDVLRSGAPSPQDGSEDRS